MLCHASLVLERPIYLRVGEDAYEDTGDTTAHHVLVQGDVSLDGLDADKDEAEILMLRLDGVQTPATALSAEELQLVKSALLDAAQRRVPRLVQTTATEEA